MLLVILFIPREAQWVQDFFLRHRVYIDNLTWYMIYKVNSKIEGCSAKKLCIGLRRHHPSFSLCAVLKSYFLAHHANTANKNPFAQLNENFFKNVLYTKNEH